MKKNKPEIVDPSMEIANYLGYSSLIFSGVFIFIVFLMIFIQSGGGSSIGPVMILFFIGFFVVIAGLVQGVRGVFTNSKSNLAKIGLIINSVIFLFCLFAMK